MNDLGIRFDPTDAGEPWVSGRDTDVLSLLSRIKRRYADRITGELILPAAAGCYADFPADLDPRLAEALRERGISRLYSHQREAWEAITAVGHTVIVTPTASGKSLCWDAQRYSELKRKLAEEHPQSIGGYMDGKDGFIKEMDRRAAQWRASQTG